MFQMWWVRILAPFTGWKFFAYICCKNDICLKKTEKTIKVAGVGHFKNNQVLAYLSNHAETSALLWFSFKLPVVG